MNFDPNRVGPLARSELFSRIFLVFLPIGGAVLLFGRYEYLLWYVVYLGLLGLEVFIRSNPFHSKKTEYRAIFALTVLQSCFFALLGVQIWMGGTELHHFAAVMVVAACMLRAGMSGIFNRPILIAEAVPLVLALLYFSSTFLTEQNDMPRFLLSLVVIVSFWSYHVVALMRHTKVHQQRLMLEKELAERQKMELVGQVSGGVAHDFNNILTVTLGNLELYREVLDPEERDHCVNEAFTAAQKGQMITRELLSYARKSLLAVEELDLGAWLPRVRPVLQGVLPSNVTLELTVVPKTPPIRIDVGQLETALLNLLLNAGEAMPEGGSVRIFASQSDKGVTIVVEDVGVGMSEATLMRAADPFFTTKPKNRSTGLGLSAVSGFVEQSGGQLSLQSRLSEGTKVVMTFPPSIIDGAAPDADVPSPPTGKPARLH